AVAEAPLAEDLDAQQVAALAQRIERARRAVVAARQADREVGAVQEAAQGSGNDALAVRELDQHGQPPERDPRPRQGMSELEERGPDPDGPCQRAVGLPERDPGQTRDRKREACQPPEEGNQQPAARSERNGTTHRRRVYRNRSARRGERNTNSASGTRL